MSCSSEKHPANGPNRDLWLTSLRKPRRNVSLRFWEKVNKTKTCWLWTASKDGMGYGMFKPEGGRLVRRVRAHRWAYEQHIGRPIKPGMLACHRCDIPGCVRPSHIFEGTPAENNSDRDQKGRHISFKGDQHPNAKLTQQQVNHVRELAATGVRNCVLAKRFKISPSAVGNILSGKTWT